MNKFFHWIFVGSSGIRAGWRLLIFAAIVALIYEIATPVIRLFPAGMEGSTVRPWLGLSDLTGLVVVLVAAWLMSRIEHRPLFIYGLPLREAFRRKFWIGFLFGSVAITAILLCLYAAGAYRINALATSGIDAVEAAVLWALVFVCAGLFEEFVFRGYVQFTLTTGTGFWIASAITSLLFGFLHMGNHGENAIGIISVICFALFHCVTLRQTGNLWMSVGFHATWDWCESFLYGVPDSGTTTWHPLFTTTFQGPVWLTGGNDGPEGSALALLAVGIMTLLVFRLYPTPRYRTKLDPASAN
ncbi:MAG: type II CAAX endopeptidase family protein [Vulcanimicrobiaceae bacterium]|jgi:membrane protease YdiL (CAAX protease family)